MVITLCLKKKNPIFIINLKRKMSITYPFCQPKIVNFNSPFWNSCINLIRNCCNKPTSNNNIQPIIYNRNPRNLERMRLQKKPTGYGLEKSNNNFWHRMIYTVKSKFIEVKLIHNTNVVVVEASTNEWAIRKFLYSAKDKQANIILARVFAERCIESGMTTFSCEKPTEKSTNYAAFYDVLEKENLILEEPDYFDIHDIWRRKREKRPWTVLED